MGRCPRCQGAGARTAPRDRDAPLRRARARREGRRRAGQAEQAQIVKSFGAEDDTRFSNFGVPGRQMVTIANYVAEADIALAQRQVKVAIAKLQAAAKAQDQLPYMEPPYWDFLCASTSARRFKANQPDRLGRRSIAKTCTNGRATAGRFTACRSRSSAKAKARSK